MRFNHLFDDGSMAKRRGIGIEKKEEQIVRSRTRSERIERVTAGLKSRKLLLLEERLRRIRIVSTERHADDFFSGRNVSRAGTFGLRGHSLRNQTPVEFINLRIRIHAPRGQEFIKLPEVVRKHLFLQL